jgi:hypothetical protein
MAQAAQEYGGDPRQLSFKGALQALSAFAERLLDAGGDKAEEGSVQSFSHIFEAPSG